jgi:hypothetical protein
MYCLRAPDTRRQTVSTLVAILPRILRTNWSLGRASQGILIKSERGPGLGTRKSHVVYRLPKGKSERGELAETTVTNYYKTTKLFCVMNDITLNWKKISGGLPSGRKAANDRLFSVTGRP